MRIYRVEHHETGEGPYVARFDDNEWPGFETAMGLNGKPHDHLWRHPIEGTRFDFDPDTRWAFRSLDKLHEWFGYFGQHGYDVLHEAGFVIAEYEVPRGAVRTYDRQVTYDPRSAEFIRTHDVDTHKEEI